MEKNNFYRVLGKYEEMISRDVGYKFEGHFESWYFYIDSSVFLHFYWQQCAFPLNTGADGGSWGFMYLGKLYSISRLLWAISWHRGMERGKEAHTFSIFYNSLSIKGACLGHLSWTPPLYCDSPKMESLQTSCCSLTSLVLSISL